MDARMDAQMDATLPLRAQLRRTTRHHVATAAVAIGSAVSAALYLAMRSATARSIPQVFSFSGYCERVNPPDVYPCHVATGAPARAWLVASLLIWLALAGVTLVLALAGRGASSFVPLATLVVAQLAASFWPEQLSVLPWLGVRDNPFWTSELGAGYWAAHHASAVVADVLLLATPAVLAMAFLRPSRVPLIWRGRPAFVRSTLLCLFGSGLIAWFAEGTTWDALGFSAGISLWVPGAVLTVYALLLPRVRGRSSSIAFAAILLSSGPSALIASASLDMTTTLWFALVLPLIVMGSVASAAERVAVWWERRADPSDDERRPPPLVDDATVRPMVVVNAVAVGLLAVSVIAASADPLPARIGTALPTYLGIRERAQDARSKQNLLQALDAANAFRAAAGSAAGFDAVGGQVLQPALRWSDGAVPERDLTVSVLRSTPNLVRVATVSASGAAFCAQATSADGWSATYGAGARHGTEGVARSLREAVARCAAEPFSAADLPELPVATLCDGLDRDGIIICRSVQHLVESILSSPRGRGVN
jgi:hypothetical protein